MRSWVILILLLPCLVTADCKSSDGKLLMKKARTDYANGDLGRAELKAIDAYGLLKDCLNKKAGNSTLDLLKQIRWEMNTTRSLADISLRSGYESKLRHDYITCIYHGRAAEERYNILLESNKSSESREVTLECREELIEELHVKLEEARVAIREAGENIGKNCTAAILLSRKGQRICSDVHNRVTTDEKGLPAVDEAVSCLSDAARVSSWVRAECGPNVARYVCANMRNPAIRDDDEALLSSAKSCMDHAEYEQNHDLLEEAKRTIGTVESRIRQKEWDAAHPKKPVKVTRTIPKKVVPEPWKIPWFEMFAALLLLGGAIIGFLKAMKL